MGTPAQTEGANARYALANGCYALKSQALGQHVVKTADGYAASAAAAPAGAEAFRMQATRLGSYLFYSPARQFMAGGGGLDGQGVRTDDKASPAADWRVDDAGSAFKIVLPSANKVLAPGEGGKLVLADAAGAGDDALFTFVRAEGCPGFPEVETSATGTPGTGATSYGETRGYIDAHMHMMAFEFLGGRAHCARPWHPTASTARWWTASTTTPTARAGCWRRRSAAAPPRTT